LVGRHEETSNGFIVHNVYVVRVWGTTGGLGQIAEGGPTSETKLDKTPTVRGRFDAMIFTIDCDETKWNM
jgi:hypothetical protein